VTLTQLTDILMMCRHSPGCWTSERGSNNYCRYYRPCGRTVQCWEKSKAYTFFIDPACYFSPTAELLPTRNKGGGLNKSYMGLFFFFFSIYGVRISALDLGGRAVLNFCH